jgi:CheY-like chemotaxis protein
MAGETTLVVDDNAVSVKLTRMLLVNESYKVVTAGSMDEAAELLRGLNPEFVLADLVSSALNRLVLASRLKHDGRTLDPLLIAAAEPGDGPNVLEAGCDAFVAKPVDARSLAPRIRALPDGREPGGSEKSATAE